MKLIEVVIATAKRTPVGSFQGSIAAISAPQLGTVAIKSVLDETQLDLSRVDEVIMGNVLTAGLGQAPARQAALYAGLPNTVECTTINKMCGSGLKAVMLGAQAIRCGDAEVVIAGGMENMSAAPYILPQGRSGYRLGHGKLEDSIIKDGLWDVYTDQHMGNCAELCAQERHYSRTEQDEYAKESYTRAKRAQENGLFGREIVPVKVPQRKGDPIVIDTDDEPSRANFEKMSTLKPAFEKEGTVTAANASKINDGAAALLLMSAAKAKNLHIQPVVKIIAQASTAHAPEWFTTAPGTAIKKVLDIASLTTADIDLWEINEAFAPVAMAAIDDHKLDPNKVNFHGGAIALGHPIGASGARILTTLIYAMLQYDKKLGCAAICIGGGEASALIVEKV